MQVNMNTNDTVRQSPNALFELSIKLKLKMIEYPLGNTNGDITVKEYKTELSKMVEELLPLCFSNKEHGPVCKDVYLKFELFLKNKIMINREYGNHRLDIEKFWKDKYEEMQAVSTWRLDQLILWMHVRRYDITKDMKNLRNIKKKALASLKERKSNAVQTLRRAVEHDASLHRRLMRIDIDIAYFTQLSFPNKIKTNKKVCFSVEKDLIIGIADSEVQRECAKIAKLNTVEHLLFKLCKKCQPIVSSKEASKPGVLTHLDNQVEHF